MADYVTLLGAEQVSNAARQIAGAAEDMRRAASQMDDTFSRQRQFLDDWLLRLESVLSQTKDKP